MKHTFASLFILSLLGIIAPGLLDCAFAQSALSDAALEVRIAYLRSQTAQIASASKDTRVDDLANALLELGKRQAAEKEARKAEQTFDEALALLSQKKGASGARNLRNAAIDAAHAFIKSGELDTGHKYVMRVFTICREAPSERAAMWVPISELQRLARAYGDAGQFEKAATLQRQIVKMVAAQPKAIIMSKVWITANELVKDNLDWGRTDTAKEFLLIALKSCKAEADRNYCGSILLQQKLELHGRLQDNEGEEKALLESAASDGREALLRLFAFYLETDRLAQAETILEKLSNGEESNKDEKWPSSSLLQACRVALLRANGRWQEADRLEALTESSTAAELQVAPPTPGCL